jgi:hypothetical protein
LLVERFLHGGDPMQSGRSITRDDDFPDRLDKRIRLDAGVEQDADGGMRELV